MSGEGGWSEPVDHLGDLKNTMQVFFKEAM